MNFPGFPRSSSLDPNTKRRGECGAAGPTQPLYISNDRRTSKVWNYYTQLNGNHVECNVCKRQLSFHNSTSSMREHLVRRHGIRDSDSTMVAPIPATSLQPVAQPSSTTANTCMFQPALTVIIKEEQQDADISAEPAEPKRARTTFANPDVGSAANAVPVSNPDLDPSNSHTELPYSVNNSVSKNKEYQKQGIKECSNKRVGVLTDLILEMVFRDLQPLSVVEEKGFRLLLSCLEPHYLVPTPSQLGSLLWYRYDAVKQHLQQYLQSGLAPHGLTLCTEYWQSVAGCEVGGGGRLFFTVSAHFVDKNWRSAHCVLETRPMPDFREEVNGSRFTQFGDTLKAILSEFNLPENFVFCVVHDTPYTPSEARGVKNMGLDRENLNNFSGQSQSPQNLPEGWVTLHCAGEALKLCIQEGLWMEPVRQSLTEVRRIISHFQHDSHAAMALSHKAQAANKAGTCLVLDDPGRWATAIEMCESLLELKWVVSSVLEEQKAAPNLADHQWRLLQELVPVLRTVRIASSFLSEDINAPISALMPCLHGVSRVLAQHIAESSCTVARGVMERVLSGMERRWRLGEEEALLDSPAILSSFLDPRFKELRFLSPYARSKLHDKVKELLSAQAQMEDSEISVQSDKGGVGKEEEDEYEEGREGGAVNLRSENVVKSRDAPLDSPVSFESNEDGDVIVLQPKVNSMTTQSQVSKDGRGEGSLCSSANGPKRVSTVTGLSSPLKVNLQPTPHKQISPVSRSMYDILLGEDPTERMPEIHQQLENYIAEPLCKRSLSPLHWWRSKERRFPAVARLARKYLAIPATAVPADRAFAPRESPVAQRRATLGPQHLDHILFLHQNCDYMERLMGRSTGYGERGNDGNGGNQTRETLYQSLVSYDSQAWLGGEEL